MVIHSESLVLKNKDFQRPSEFTYYHYLKHETGIFQRLHVLSSHASTSTKQAIHYCCLRR